MPLSTVTLTWDLTDLVQDGQAGTLTIRPTAQITGPLAGITAAAVPKIVEFTGGTGELPGIIALDNVGISPAPPYVAYQITVKAGGQILPGYPFSAFILSADGATQDLADLVHVATPDAMRAFMPAPDGSPSARELPFATGTGSVSAWGVLQAPDIPALPYDPQGAAAAAVGAVSAETTRAQAAEALALPKAQSFALASDTYSTPLAFTVTGQTDDPLPKFGITAGSQTYSSGGVFTQGPAFWFGYNPEFLAGSLPASPHGAIGISCFGDAGDTNVSGRHGLEMNPACFRTPDGTKGTNALEVVAVDDNSNTVSTQIRCGTGTAGNKSGIVLQNADASQNYLTMGPAYANIITLYQNTTVTAANPIFQVVGTAHGSATFELSSQTDAGSFSQFIFQGAGVNKWGFTFAVSGGNLFTLQNYINGTPHAFFIPGATYPAAQTWLLSQLKIWDSLICGAAALATTATTGFFYVPSCAGVPTGIPQAQAGVVPVVFDTVHNKIYANPTQASGGWIATPALS